MTAALAINDHAFQSNQSISAIGQVNNTGWETDVSNRLEVLQRLNSNWDLQGAYPIRDDVINFAVTMLSGIMANTTPAPQIFPLANGGIQLEWHERGIDLEIEIPRPGDIYFTFDDLRTGTEDEGPLSSNFFKLLEPIHLLSER